jgi:chromosome segregation protein
LKERLSVEFGLDINELFEKDPSPDWTEETLKEKVSKQKLQLENYGPINPMAVEAFNEIKDRHTFIIEQKDDLARAKESLLQTISEIEMTAKDNFMKAFIEIRTNFIKVFRSLFTEDDDCDLILLDPSNPTESDVQIIAKPKGKRPLSISQLSGGEKTLTAIALLFGIYLIKPAPFCIFDEVDAPLDDTNIDKFNNIIKKFSVDSQFIIITHNKRTMTATDIIYGITMAELGVTQVVPVDLTEVVEN